MNHIIGQSFIFEEDDNSFLYENFFNSLKNINYKDKLAIFTNKPSLISQWATGLNIKIIEKNYNSKIQLLVHNEFTEKYKSTHFLKIVFLKEYIKDLDENDKIFYADAKDSIFQGDIFNVNVDFNKLNYSTEDKFFFNEWSQKHSISFSKEAFNFFLDKKNTFKMINAGGFLTNVCTLRKYIEYYEEIIFLDRKNNTQLIDDQCILNKNYYFRKCPFINLIDNLILCSGWYNELIFEDGKFLLNGVPPIWVHQYERNPKFKLPLFKN